MSKNSGIDSSIDSGSAEELSLKTGEELSVFFVLGFFTNRKKKISVGTVNNMIINHIMPLVMFVFGDKVVCSVIFEVVVVIGLSCTEESSARFVKGLLKVHLWLYT